MPDMPKSPPSNVRYFVLIAVIVAGLVLAFSYTAGWLTPTRLTPAKLVDSLAPPGGAVPGFRRNHAKGICFTGSFVSNGAGAEVSSAPMLAAGSFPVTGRFNLASPDPKAQDSMERVRGMSLRIVAPDGAEWRMAMIDAPFFPVATPQAFYELQKVLALKDDPDAVKQFVSAHPAVGAFVGWTQSAPWTGSFAEDRFNGLNSFVFTDAHGRSQVVRWSFVPLSQPEALSADQIAKRGPDFLDAEIRQRVSTSPQKWKLLVTVANPGDPTNDPSKVWPDDRHQIDAGTLVVSAIESEPGGPCRNLNFDPTVLPPGMHVSDDPFPAARSAAYSVSFNRRTSEDSQYPHPGSDGAQP